MRRQLVALLTAAALLLGGAGVAVAATGPRLVASGPTEVSGTEASAVFRLGDRTIRQVRYLDRRRLTYSFTLANEGLLPVTVTGLAPLEREPRLFRYTRLTDVDGAAEFTLAPGERTTVDLEMLMHSCETLSARAGSFAAEVRLALRSAGVVDGVASAALPEEVHTGSPREASCPRATATSRPPG